MEGNEDDTWFHLSLVRIRHKGALGFRIRPYFSKFLGPFSLTGTYGTRWCKDFPSFLELWRRNSVNLSCCSVSYGIYSGFFQMPCIWTPFPYLGTHLHYTSWWGAGSTSKWTSSDASFIRMACSQGLGLVNWRDLTWISDWELVT